MELIQLIVLIILIFCHPVATDVTEGKADLGIVICGLEQVQ
jgi:hypothetical protein